VRPVSKQALARLAPDGVLPPPRPGALPMWPGRSVELDGAVMFVRETAGTSDAAEPAVYLHGLGGSAQNWTDLAGLLADRLDGQAVDLPGFGQSDPPGPRGYRPTALAARVVRWIEHSGRAPVHLFGNSLGGAVAVRVAATRPDLIRTLTLISPAMPFYQPGRAHVHMLPVILLPRVERAVERRIRAMSPEELVRGVLAMCFADPSRFGPERLAEAVAEAAERQQLPWAAGAYVGSLRGLATAYLVPGSRSLWRLAARITAPTLVVWGRQDRFVDVRLAPRTARAIRGSRLLLLDGVGHTAHVEVPRILARAVLAFLDEADAVAVQNRQD
jgi:pimeloyl-ACP methyl ester carboxylesterase